MSGFVQKKVARVIEGLDKNFSHTFGGESGYQGTTPKGCKLPLHLVYTFDTTDPKFPIQIPGIRFLPLLYSFPYNAGACGYRVKSEREIEVFYMETKTVERNFPYPDYPPEFPERSVRLEPISCEHQKVLAFFIESGRRALSKADQKLIFEEFRYPFTQLGGIHKMPQGIPDVPCPNRQCRNHKHTSCMDVFAVIWNEPHSGVFLWDNETPQGCDVQLIFQICPDCHSIHACNRCT